MLEVVEVYLPTIIAILEVGEIYLLTIKIKKYNTVKLKFHKCMGLYCQVQVS